MDSHEMNEDPINTLGRLKFRVVRLNQLTLTPGTFVLVGAVHMGAGGMVSFPAQLEVGVNGRNWQRVDFVDALLVTDEDRPEAEEMLNK